MKSKEAFKKMCKNLNSYEFTDEFKQTKKQIIKDLEILEILKKHLHIRNGTWSDIITCNIDSLTNENYEILEEWLKNE